MDTISRRRFLLASGVAGAGALVAGAATLPHGALDWHAVNNPLAGDAHVLVLVTLYGGNDGLNTVVPYADPAYHDARPDMSYSDEEVHKLSDGLGLNPALKGLSSLWQDKQLAIVRGAGYPKPDFSHFRSMDIWQTASPSTPVAVGLDRPLARRGRRRPGARAEYRLGAGAGGGRRSVHRRRARRRRARSAAPGVRVGGERTGPGGGRLERRRQRGAHVLPQRADGDQDVRAGAGRVGRHRQHPGRQRDGQRDGQGEGEEGRGRGRQQRPVVQRPRRPARLRRPVHQGEGPDPGLSGQPRRVRHARRREGHPGGAAADVRRRRRRLPQGHERRRQRAQGRAHGLLGVRPPGGRQRRRRAPTTARPARCSWPARRSRAASTASSRP